MQSCWLPTFAHFVMQYVVLFSLLVCVWLLRLLAIAEPMVSDPSELQIISQAMTEESDQCASPECSSTF